MRVDTTQIQKWVADDLEEMSMQVNRLEQQGMSRELATLQVAYHYGILRGFRMAGPDLDKAIKDEDDGR